MELMSVQADGPRAAFDVGIGVRSQANLYRGFDSEAPIGVFVPTWNIYPVGTHVRVSMDLPHAPRIETAAVVQWVRETARESMWPGLGLAFVSLTPAQRRALQAFCELRPPMFYEG